jgi:acyl-CoA thioesterase-1
MMKLKGFSCNRLIKSAVFIGALLSLGIGSTVSIALIAMRKSPSNTPDKFRAQPHKKLVVCIGDSITQGTISFNYVDVLSSSVSLMDYTFINAGVNGDLAYNALTRVNSIINLNPDYVFILLGTNDVNATLSQENELMYIKNKNLPEKPSKEWFKKNLYSLIKSLKQKTSSKIAILSIPVIGEKLGSAELRKTIDYSLIIKELAKNESLVYLPLNEMQLEFLEAKNHTPGTVYSAKASKILMLQNAYMHYILQMGWQSISAKRGLLLSTDTIHQNDITGKMINELISNFLLGN